MLCCGNNFFFFIWRHKRGETWDQIWLLSPLNPTWTGGLTSVRGRIRTSCDRLISALMSSVLQEVSTSTWWGSIKRSQFILRGTRTPSCRWGGTDQSINSNSGFFCWSLFEAETIDDSSDQVSVGFIPPAPPREWWCNTEIYNPGVLRRRCWTTGTSASPEIQSIIINTADQWQELSM